MLTSNRFVIVLVLTALAAPLVIAETAAQSIPATEAQAFLGEWNVALDGDVSVTVRLNISDRDGQVAAVLTLDGNATQIQEISKAGEELVLRFETDVQGQQTPVAVALRPDGERLTAHVDVGGGMMMIPGQATRR